MKLCEKRSSSSLHLYFGKLANTGSQGVIIERLKFEVAPHLRENFIQKGTQIWTTALAEYPGFLSKEVWIQPQLSYISYTEQSQLTKTKGKIPSFEGK
ncbi:TIGR03792 family protein [Nostoc punctiforme]|uniref:TIGR03792 family protein n=1 Tax=Nostoc punctiforme TaxID=272131 RepID=UPI003CC8B9AA